jgi:hypothetical protein
MVDIHGLVPDRAPGSNVLRWFAGVNDAGKEQAVWQLRKRFAADDAGLRRAGAADRTAPRMMERFEHYPLTFGRTAL